MPDTGVIIARKQEIARNLRDLRNARKLSQGMLAKSIGISRAAVSQWETAETMPKPKNLLLLAELYGVPYERITGLASANESIDRELELLDERAASALRASFLIQIAAVMKPEKQ